MNPKEVLIEKENEHIAWLVEEHEKALTARIAAGRAWQDAHDDDKGTCGAAALLAAHAMDEAEMSYRAAERALAAHIASLVRTGWQVTLPDKDTK